ncbi:MAG TPA: prolyl oligopeptidase family serine peptidase [Rhizomicrobium sp.]|nr:prolyl oligopeptidase family serine peptidase [Rhizomicrobium sp.]
MLFSRRAAFALFAVCALPFAPPAHAANFTMAQVLDYPFVSDLTAAEHGDHIAWVRNLGGARNVWLADGPSFKPRQITHYTADDGQEITQLTFSPDGAHLVYVRGGDHDANWPAEDNLAPDPDSSTTQPMVTIWAASLSGGAPVKVAEGDAPALSAKAKLAYINNNQIWTASLDGKGKPQRMFFDHGKDGSLAWSPDGSELAFVSNRGDHSFIGVFALKDKPLLYLAPSTNFDAMPRWSPDGARIAFTRQLGDGGPPDPILKEVPQPWSIWVANAADGTGNRVWQSPNTLPGSYPDVEGGANLHWGAGDRIVFLSYVDNWPHLYSVPSSGGKPLLLTAGNYMVEYVTESRDRRFMIYNANTGTTAGDGDRRHIFRVPVDTTTPQALTSGDTIEWQPTAASDDRVAFIIAGVQQPPSVGIVGADGQHRANLDIPLPADFPLASLITPKPVIFKAADGLTAHGQLFQSAGAKSQPGIIFVHGGPPRQMLLGWHYMDYYSNSYAVNQYLANHGFTVLSVNYRLGIGYGRAYHHPEHAGPAGASEYQDVVAGAHFLQAVPNVDPKRIGIWGGSYGGYLTAMGLSHNSDIFKVGVDMHGVHDWSRFIDAWFGKAAPRYEKGDREQALKVAWESSPDSMVDHWKSPVLLIQGDDDRNVYFQQTIDLARRLETRHLPYEELVIPNEIHGFLRHDSWLRADTASVDFFAAKFGVH